MANQADMTPPKEHSNFPVMDPKEVDIGSLPYKELKTVVLRELGEL